jgi:hypothetical protein
MTMMTTMMIAAWCVAGHRRMDYILQKDADSKAARKRKKAAVKAAASSKTTAAAAAAGSDAAEAGTVDPQAAAAALRAFGAVVGLCTQPGCRRVKLLRHFEEDYTPKQQQQKQQVPRLASCTSSSSSTGAAAAAAMPCCDYCDAPSAVEAAQQQLKDAEVALLQQFRGGRGGWQRGGGKRQRLGDGMIGDAASGSENDSGGGEAGYVRGMEVVREIKAYCILLHAVLCLYSLSEIHKQFRPCNSPHMCAGILCNTCCRAGGSSDDDVELDPDSAAAAAAVAKAAAAAKAGGKQAASSDSTDVFLAAMLRAEQRHERQQQHAGSGDGDPLKRLLAAKGSAQPVSTCRGANTWC